MAAHRYWRIRSPTVNPYGLSEIEMRTTVGGSDVTTGKTAIASGFYTGFPPSNTIDNDNNTFWTTFTVPQPTGGHWIGVDFGSGGDVEILEFSLRSRGDGFSSEAPPDPIFEWSDDSTTWTMVGNVTGLSWSVGETKLFNVTSPTPERLSQTAVEVTRTGAVDARLSQTAVEITRTGPVDAQLSQTAVEVMRNGPVEARLSQCAVEVFYIAAPPRTPQPILFVVT